LFAEHREGALASDEPPRYERARPGSLADAYDRRIGELLTAFLRMPATVIAERIEWPYSIRTLSTRVAEVAADLCAAGAGLAHQLSGWEDRPV
jgi:hypothetical protein